jgi:hypothetical protein
MRAKTPGGGRHCSFAAMLAGMARSYSKLAAMLAGMARSYSKLAAMPCPASL